MEGFPKLLEACNGRRANCPRGVGTKYFPASDHHVCLGCFFPSFLGKIDFFVCGVLCVRVSEE